MSKRKDKPVSYGLSAGQQSLVRALSNSRQQVVDDANRAIAEINIALDEACDLIAAQLDLPADRKYRFNRLGNSFVIEEMPEAEPTEPQQPAREAVPRPEEEPEVGGDINA